MKRKTKQGSLLKGRMMLLTKLFLIGIFLVSQLGAFAQQSTTITGTITEEGGQPLPGVTVLLKGTTTGTVSSIDGIYTIPDVPENATLSISFVGMKTQEIVVGNQTSINVTMQTDAIGLDEVVAIGYGTVKKKDVTGAIVNVNAEKLMKNKPTNVSDLLRGSVAGLQVGYSTDARATPDFLIRGENTIKANANDERIANAPLIVLDGVIFNGSLSEINVNDIKSVDVLKDASAASIYGSRASNGVVVFTTKRGEIGKPTIRVNAQYGIVTSSKRLTSHDSEEVIDWLVDMNESVGNLLMDDWSVFEPYNRVPDQYKADWLAANDIPGETDPDIISTAWLNNVGFEASEKENFLAGNRYDWQDWLFQTGQKQDYNVSISGRSKATSYYWSVGFKDNESLQAGETFKSITSRFNFDVKVTDYLNVGLNANFAYEDEGQQPIGSSGYETLSPYDSPWLVGQEQTKENLALAAAGSNRSNPLLNPAYMTREFDRYRVSPTVYAKLNLPFGITFTSRFSQRFDIRTRFQFNDPMHPLWTHGGEIRRRHNKFYGWQSDNILNWNKEFGLHRFDVTGLWNAEENNNWYTDAFTSQLSPNAALGFHEMAFGLQPSNDSSDESNSRTALMGRVNYSYGSKYHLSASIRRDGFSRFGSNHLYATFPSVSGGWTMSNEEFMSSAPSWLSFLKLRLSWGVNGNSSGLGAYAAYAQLSDNKFLLYDNGYALSSYLSVNRLGNSDLAWEKNDSWNVGIDYGFWDGRLRGSLDIYSSETTDLLLDKVLPIITGFSSVTTNVGNLKNTGFDLSINSINIDKGDFLWTSNLNVHFNKNEIVSLTGEKMIKTDEEGNPVLDSNGAPVMVEPNDTENGWFIGEDKDVIWDYETDGVYQLGEEADAAVYGLFPGDFRIVDQNDDGKLNTFDKVYQGTKSNPWHIAFTNNFTYKQFDLGLVIISKLGYKGGSTWPLNNAQQYIKNHNWYKIPYWTPDNPINDYARINSVIPANLDIWMARSYVRLQNFSLGYTIPLDILETVKFSNARIAFNIENAAVFTKWELGDPESMLEMPRIYSFSVDFSF
jgi:TonB-linked SusC/RagA family outer membrane protein